MIRKLAIAIFLTMLAPTTALAQAACGEREKILADLRVLRDHAEAAGIDFKVDDEFDGLAAASEDEFEKNRIRRLANPDGVYRLVPDGRCSKGADILKPLTDQTPRWDRKTMDAGAFLATL